MASRSSAQTVSSCILPFRWSGRYQRSLRVKRLSSPSGIRQLSTGAAKQFDEPVNATERPRWSHTPETAMAPVSLHKRGTFGWRTNNDPVLLDRVYTRMLGEGGDKMLTEEVKWLAVTHKSFDQGRRGYNERLAFFGEPGLGIASVKWKRIRTEKLCLLVGRRIVALQASLNIIMSDASRDASSVVPSDPYGRIPFKPPALEGLESLTEDSLFDVIDTQRIAPLAHKYGLAQVIRWLPKKV